jgi:hypothetical protein
MMAKFKRDRVGIQGPAGPPSTAVGDVVVAQSQMLVGGTGGTPVSVPGDVHVEAFFPVAATRADAWQAAIDSAENAGGGRVVTRTPYHAFEKGLNLRDNVYVECGDTHLDFSGMTTPVSNSAIYGAGSLTALPALASNIARHSRTVTFASAPAVAPGDVVVLYDSADYSFAPMRTYYRAGEFLRVVSVATNTVTFSSPTYAAYLSGGTVSAYKVNPIRTGISGARITGKPSSNVISIALGTDLRMEDVRLTGTNWSHLLLDRCYDVDLSHVRAVDYQASVGLNYGVNLSNCQLVRIDASTLDTTRHGFVTGGTNATGCVPCRDIDITDSSINGIDTSGGIAGCNLHGNSEYIRFNNCRLPAGFNPAGDHITMTNCDLWSNAGGYIVYGSELLGADITFEQCTFHATMNHPLNRAFVWMPYDEDGLTRTGGVFKFNNNTLNLGAYTAASGTTAGLLLYTTLATSLPSSNDVEACSNTILSTAAPTGSAMFGLMIRAVSGRAFRNIKATGNSGDLGIYVLEAGPQYLDLSGNAFIDPAWKGIDVQWPATPQYSNSVITMADVTVLRAHHTGIEIEGRQSDTVLLMDNVAALNCTQMGNTGNSDTNGSMYIHDFLRVERKQCRMGDYQAVPTQTRLDGLRNITTLVDENNENLGSVTTRNITSVTTHRFRGSGAGAPTFAAAVGSEYARTDGGASTTKYINETGTTTWRAL